MGCDSWTKIGLRKVEVSGVFCCCCFCFCFKFSLCSTKEDSDGLN